MASGLRQRVPTALALAAAVVAILLWTPPAVAVTVIAIIMLAGAWEWAALAGLSSSASRAAYVLAVAGGIVLDWWYTSGDAERIMFLRIAAAWWLLAFFWLVFATQRGGQRAAAVVGWIVLATAAVSLGRLVLVEPHGRGLLLFLLILIAAADVGAFFGGRQFGRRKLAPRISPGKTWEGFAAGMLTACAAAAAGAFYFDVPLLPWLALCVLVALVSVVGDLLESMFKRRVGLKDSGNLLPGHGGVLDRIDSVTAAAPVYLLGLVVLGMA